MKTVSAMVDDVYVSFGLCKLALANDGGGQMRSKKGALWEEYAKQVLLHVIDRNALLLCVEGKKTVRIPDGNGLFVDIEMDIALCDEIKNPRYHVEVKDYIDATMYRRFIADSLCLSRKFPDMKHISLSGWVASEPLTQAAINSVLGLTGFVFADTLLPLKRKAKDNLYLLSQDKRKIVSSTEDLIVRLTKVIT